MASFDVAHEAKDILQKRTYGILGNGVIRRFRLNLPPIVAQLPTDLPVLEVRAQYADRLFQLADDSLLDLEMQSDFAAEDVLRFGDYSWTGFRQHRKKVHTVVIYGPAVTVEPPDVVDAGGHTFRLTNILLAREDGDATLARLREKVAHGEPLDDVDRVDLALTPLLRHRRALNDVMPEVVPLVQALPEEERAEPVGTILGLAYHYLDDSVAAAILEVLKMTNALEEMIAQGITRGLEEGRAEGRAEGLREGEDVGKRAALLTLLRSRFGTVPPALEARIAMARGTSLDALIAQAAIADRVELLA
jgi:hypothetical protein